MDNLVPLQAQIGCAEREFKYRMRVYPRWVSQGKMTDQQSTHELAAMRAVINTLQQLERGERLL